jgi:DNA ligase-associated metallophosphoesterase
MSSSAPAAQPLELEWAGLRLLLFGERALAVPELGLLIASDAHFGKDQSLRAAGLAVPPGALARDLARLDGLLAACQPRSMVWLGDLIHSETSLAPENEAELAAWFAAHRDLEIVLVRGNHDRRAGDPPDAWGLDCRDGPLRIGALELCHYPPDQRADRSPPQPGEPARLWLAGHLHPGVDLRGRSGARVRAPCFRLLPRSPRRPAGLVLPAFGSLTGIHPTPPDPGERRFLCSAEGVFPWPPG